MEFLHDFYLIPKFSNFSKRNLCCNNISGHLLYQILSRYIYFLQTYNPKPSPLMTSFFQTAILSISRHYAEKMTFLESLDQAGSEAHICYPKIQIRKFDFL